MPAKDGGADRDEIKWYMAGPLGFSEPGRDYFYNRLIPAVTSCSNERYIHSVIDPWKLTEKERIDSAAMLPYGPGRKAAWANVNPVIGGNNADAILRCDAMVAVLDGTDVDSGTAWEIGFCNGSSGFGKPVIGLRTDFRLASDNEGSLVNLQVEYGIMRSLYDLRVPHIVSNLDGLRACVRSIYPPARPR
jgi:hypothetical protein